MADDQTVTQADREAALKLLPMNTALELERAMDVRSGRRDGDATVQAFAAHRIESTRADGGEGEAMPAEILERAQANWRRFFYPEHGDFVKSCGCLSQTGVPLSVADSLREVLNWMAGQEATQDPTHIRSITHRTAHSGEGRSNGAGEFVVAGPWEHRDETSGETHWSAEVQIVGGHASAAEVFGATAEEAKGRADMIAAALSAPQGEVGRLRDALERIAKLTPASANAHTAQDLCLTVRAIAESALAQPEGAKSD